MLKTIFPNFYTMRFKIFCFSCLLVWNCLNSFAQERYNAVVDQQVEEILSKMNVDEKLSYIGGIDWMYTKNIDRLGIHRMKMTDGPQGLGTHGKSTAYPATIMLAATWNEELAYQYGKSLGRDCRARGINILLGPAVNIYRAPMCGRNFEYMGEDPYLTSRMVVGYIKGVQDQGVIATVKHFAANNSEYDRNNISNDIDERTLHEIYFPAFKAAVQEAKVGAVMTSYNLLNGIYTTENPWLLKEILRNKWGFKGLVMSDWGSTHFAIPAAKSGLDLEMAGGEKMNPKDMAYYLKTGDVTMDMVDEKVRHILRVLLAFQLKDGIQQDNNIPLDDPLSATTAKAVAREGIVLLKNESNILPLNTGKIKKILVIGKNAFGYVHGGGSGSVNPFRYVSIFDGVKKEASLKNIAVEYVDEFDFLPKINFTNEAHAEQGFLAAYYNNSNLQGQPIFRQVERKIDYSWGNGTGIKDISKDNFSVSWSGVLRSEETAEYDFTLGGDDGYRMFINDEPVINEWTDGGYRSTNVTKWLQKGINYKIRFDYYQKGGNASVNFIWKKKDDTTDHYANYLNKADVIIACIGHNSDTEGEGADRTFELPASNSKIISGIMKSKKPVIGVVTAGGSVDMQEWEPRLKGLLWNWYAGQEGGTALAEVLFGKVNPSGKLPMTFEKKWEDNPTFKNYYDPDGDKHVAYKEGIFVGYRGYDKLKREVQYPFGFGLSYTSFKISDITVSDTDAKGEVTITARLTNVGKMFGAEVLQVYVGKTQGGLVVRPEKELKKIKKIFLSPGRSEVVTIKFSEEDFTYYDVKTKGFVKDSGQYNIMLGFSSRDIKFSKTINVKEN